MIATFAAHLRGRRSAAQSDAGFTLPELLLAIVISTVLVGSIANAFISGLRTVDETSSRLADSFDAQLVTRYLVADVQSASSSDIKVDGRFTLLTGCADSTDDVLRLLSPGRSGPATATRYELRTAGTTKELVRHHCGDLSASTTPLSVVVGHDLTSSVAQISSGVLELVITTTSAQAWVISSHPRPGRSLSIAPTTPPPVSTTPALTSLEAWDEDGNGFIEKILATFNADIACTGGSCAKDRWTLAGSAPSGAVLDTVGLSGAVATLSLSGHSSTLATSLASDFTVTLSEGTGGIEAATLPTGQSSFAATAPADKAAPVLTGIDMLEVSANGKVDRLDATFTEALASSSDASVWSLAGVPSDGSLGTVSTSGPTAKLVVTEGSGAADTTVGSLKVTLAAGASGIRDIAGNQSHFADAIPSDKAGPALTSLSSANGATQATWAELGDTVTVKFSEPLVSLPSVTTDVRLSVAGGARITLDIPGLTAAAFQIGKAPDYLAANSTDAVFVASAMTLSDGGRTLTVTLGATAGASLNTGAHVARDVTAMSPSAALGDSAGNPAVGAVLPTEVFF